MDKTTNPYFKNSRVPPVAENKAGFVLVKHIFSICFSIPVFTSTYKNIKNFESEIFKHTIPGKPDAEEATRTEGCVKKNIKDNCNLTHKNLPVYYADLLLPITE